ncbi:MAG TPA: hypothetical protein VGK27_13820 [Candidatus Deferrimicrobiaceae bacterium]|jgi:hypothetical protein
MSEKSIDRHPAVPSQLAMLLPGVLLMFICFSWGSARASDNVAVLRLTVGEIMAESPSAVQKLIGVYSQIPGFPAGGKAVKLYVFRGTDVVCTAPIKATQKDKFDCWHFDDAPGPVQKLVNEKDAEFSEK